MKNVRKAHRNSCTSWVSLSPQKDSLGKGSYSPTVNGGKHMTWNIYAAVEKKSEGKSAQLIREMKQEIAAIRAQAKTGRKR